MWANSRRHYDVGYGVKTLDDLHAVIAFFEARLGRLYGFRFKDFADFKSCAPNESVTPLDQPIGTGDGTTTQFQLIKTYISGPSNWIRTIGKPLAGTMRVAVAGVEQTSGITIDDTTGLIAFDSAPAAAAGDYRGLRIRHAGALRHGFTVDQSRPISRPAKSRASRWWRFD